VSKAVEDALEQALRGLPAPAEPPPMPAPPADIEAAAQFYGGGAEANKAIAKQLGVSVRQVQRARKAARGEGGETRNLSTAGLKRVKSTARRRQLSIWRKAVAAAKATIAPTQRIRRRGIDMRIRGWLIVSAPPARVHTMPADAHVGRNRRHRTVHVPGELLGDAMGLWEAGDREAAAEAVEGAFLTAYELPSTADRPVELEHVEWAQIEPA
jgi:hypothetical protein